MKLHQPSMFRCALRCWDLLADLSKRLGLSYLFVSHDLEVVRAVTDRVLIMQNGTIVEQGATESVFSDPQHPYTQSLIDVKPSLNAEIARRKRKEIEDTRFNST